MNFEPDLKQYTICSVMGSCFSDRAIVFLGKHNKSGNLVAMKNFNLDSMSKTDCQLIQDEIYNTRQLMHPNLIPYVTSFLDKSQLYVVFPLMGYGSCRDLLRNHFVEGLPETVIAFVLRDVLQGLEYIHNKGLIHRSVECCAPFYSSSRGRVKEATKGAFAPGRLGLVKLRGDSSLLLVVAF